MPLKALRSDFRFFREKASLPVFCMWPSQASEHPLDLTGAQLQFCLEGNGPAYAVGSEPAVR